MAKRKSDHAFVLACNPGYSFGMISTMNAQHYFGTDADWEVAYLDYPEEDRERISRLHPRNVNWTSHDELTKEINDHRIERGNGLHEQWLTGWVLAHKVLKEKKYKAVCIIQADEFMMVNLDGYFKIAEQGGLVCSEVLGHKVADFKYGDIRNNRMMWFGLFDGLVFIGQHDFMLPRQFVDFHERIDWYCNFKDDNIDYQRLESNPLFIDIMERAQEGEITALNGVQWCGDPDYHIAKYSVEGDNFFRELNGEKIQLYGWHRRWWLPFEVTHPIVRDNVNVAKSFMERFNDMIPEMSSQLYVKGYVK